jgi:hypothetical protein
MSLQSTSSIAPVSFCSERAVIEALCQSRCQIAEGILKLDLLLKFTCTPAQAIRKFIYNRKAKQAPEDPVPETRHSRSDVLGRSAGIGKSTKRAEV